MREKLLILDDERLILTSLENLFEDDYEVFATTDAEKALRLAAEHDIAVILCDERMPGVSGHEFQRRVKDVSRATRIMMSGYADMSALTEAVNSGQIFAYIAKPWEPRKLMADISAATARFKLVQEVDHERGLLRALMENIPDPIYFKDCQSRFTRVNRAYARVIGATDSEECIGRTDGDYFESEPALRWRAEEQEILRSGLPEIDRIEHLENPGCGHRWMLRTKVPMFDRGGQVSGLACISRDITALKNSEEMLREQSERNRLIIETAIDAFIGMDPDGTITAWNPQAERTFGWAAAEVTGRTLCDTVIAPDYREAHKQGLSHFLTTPPESLVNRTIELVAVHRDGHQFPVETTFWPVQAGGAYTFNAFVRDISERRSAEEVRKKEQALLQLLQLVTVAANRSSNLEDTAQTCLELICAHTGWPLGHVYLSSKTSQEKMISAAWRHAKDDLRFVAFREASDSFADGTGLPGCVLASGKPQWIVDLAGEDPPSERTLAARRAGLRSGFGFPILVEEKIIGVVEFFSLQTARPDEAFLTVMAHIGSQLEQVSRRQRAEEDLLLAKAIAESANKAKSEFLTNMSHEMRTPMNAILGMADLLSQSPLAEEQQNYVHIFQEAGVSLLALINDILDLSKVESGQLKLESIGFDLAAYLDKIIAMMASRAHGRGLHLTLEVMPGVPLGVMGDPNRLRQILINLVGNALKFTEQGSVTLRVEPDPDGAPDWLRFSVEDTGIGIAADKTEMIFERFTQADSSTTRTYGGTGLGLAISKGLVELMGGRIGCISELGKGSTFFITAPFEICKEAEVPKTAPPAPIPTLSGVLSAARPNSRLLIVEDSHHNVILIDLYLKGRGFQLDYATNGKIAVEKVISGNPDLVLMDIQMPVMDGLEATRAIRQWEAKTNSHRRPILALTADAGEEAVARSLDAGCTEHFTKPIKQALLLEVLSHYLSGKIRITPPSGIESLVADYLVHIRRDIGVILTAVNSKDCEVARKLGHDFKGSGESYGFPEIARTGAAVELAAVASNGDEIRTQIVALSNYLDLVEIVA